MSDNSILAEYLADCGYRIFPCSGKVPMIPKWQEMATSDLSMVEAWWEKWPQANVAIHCKGLLVIDIDVNHNEGQDGFKWYETLTSEQIMSLSGAMQVNTPRGGMHLYFRNKDDKGRCSVSDIFEGVDTKVEGGYVMAMGNDNYTLEVLSEPLAITELEEAPDWLYDILKTRKTKESKSIGNIITSGNRNGALTSMAGTMRRMGMDQNEIYAGISAVNDNRCDPKLKDSEVINIAKSVAKYEPDQIDTLLTEGIDEIKLNMAKKNRKEPIVPESLLEIDGFVGDMMNYNQECAPYPNKVIAFCGAISLLSLLIGRKIRDSSDIRPNLYVLALANSSAGKDHPRKTNMRILRKIGLQEECAEKFASGEGVQDALMNHPRILFQTDECDDIMRALKHNQGGYYEGIISTLLTMYTYSNSSFPMRKKAFSKKENADLTPKFIDEPHLGMFGTAIPSHYYESLSSRLLTNGLFARMMILDAGKRGKGQNSTIKTLPKKIIEPCEYWKSLERVDDEAIIIPYTNLAEDAISEFRVYCEQQYDKSEAQGDAVGCTVWGRSIEQARKLAMVHAFSNDFKTDVIDVDSVIWATTLMKAMIDRMLYMADMYSSDSNLQHLISKITSCLHKVTDNKIAHTELMRKTKVSAKELKEAIETMVERGNLLIYGEGEGVRRIKMYRLIND